MIDKAAEKLQISGHRQDVDYKKMYHIMMNATEAALNILIEAQRRCEEIYLGAGQAEHDAR